MSAPGSPRPRLFSEKFVAVASPEEASAKADLLDLLLDATHDGILDWDVASDVATYNPRWKYLFGLDEQKVTENANLWLDLVHPDDVQWVSVMLTDHLEHGWPFVATVRMRHPQAGYRHILCRGTARRDAEGRARRVVILFSDIDDQIRVEAREKALVAALPDTLLRVRRNGTILGLKRGTERSGSPFASLREGASLADCLSDESVSGAFSGEMAARASGSAARLFEVASGRPAMYHEVRMVPAGADEWLFVIRDITERRELEQQLLQSQKLQAIGHLAAGVAHEINTPLQFIGDNLHFTRDAIGALFTLASRLKELLERERGDELRAEIEEAEAEADLEFARDQLPVAVDRSLVGVERVTKIVRALKSFAHPGAVEFEPADVNALVENATLMATTEWKYVAELELVLAPSLPRVPCVAGDVSQVVLNLVVNAAHAIAEVVGTSGAKGAIRVETRHDETHVEISIGDTGIGIPEHARSKVFDPFFTTKDVGKGTGQGLAIAHTSVVERHKGTIHFTTELGCGTTFVVRLPLER
jgi:PAS domain S-box-containing protein